MIILVINSGSSSVKYQLFEMPACKVMAKGVVEKIGMKDSYIRIQKSDNAGLQIEKKISDHKSGIYFILNLLTNTRYGCLKNIALIGAIGHRVGHGGEKYMTPVVINDPLIDELEEFNKLAPLHNPHNIAGIRIFRELLPRVQQVAVFDTGFHKTIPEYAYLYGIPYSLYTKHHIRRYGFHGTSHSYVSNRACELLIADIKSQKIITCHLGNGSSLAAIDGGKSIDTSMGFTPLEGLLMGTRPGDIDAGAVFYLMEKEKTDLNSLNRLFYEQSGMLGISGLSHDMREIEETAFVKRNKKAKLAYTMFCYRIKKYIGAYTAALNGLNILVFTGGIGENSPAVRENICNGLSFLGIDIDSGANKNNQKKERIISSEKSKITVMVIPANEEYVIAKETYNLVSQKKKT